MSDIEKVMKGLECCFEDFANDWRDCNECPYQATKEERKVVDWQCHWRELLDDALVLLREQEERRKQVDEALSKLSELQQVPTEDHRKVAVELHDRMWHMRQVTYCYECKSWDLNQMNNARSCYCPEINLRTDATFFCACGKRKDEKDETDTN